jgi:exonuclease SbcC
MIKLLRLTFVNIGRFTEEQSIDFSNRTKLIQVDGKNENTGGSSGSGKSTVFHALDYLFGINDTPSNSLQARLSKSPIKVTGEFDIDGKNVIVSRGKGSLSVNINGEIAEGSISLSEEKMDQILGIPRNLFKKMIHKKQKEGGFFLNLTAKESFDFLIKMLGLDIWSERSDKIDEDVKKFKEELLRIQSESDNIKSSKIEIESILSSKIEPKCSVDRDVVDRLGKELYDLDMSLILVNNEINNDISLINKPIKENINNKEYYSSKMIMIEQQIGKLENDKKTKVNEILKEKEGLRLGLEKASNGLNDIKNSKDKITRISEDVKGLKIHKDHLESQKCPTCMQKWIGDSANQKISDIQSSIDLKIKDLLSLKNTISEEQNLLSLKKDVTENIQLLDSKDYLSTFNKDISALTENLINIKSELKNVEIQNDNKYKSDVLNYEKTISDIRKAKEKTINDIKDSISSKKINLNNSKSELKNYEISLSIYKNEIETLKNSILNKSILVNNSESRILELNDNISIAEESKRFVKSYMLQMFQDSLDYIGSYASNMLNNIPNMVNASIYFEGCKENKNGKIKDEVNAIINMDGDNEINIKTLSGGERTAVDLAVDMAVIDMIESKAGKGADFFILDEPFVGLDAVSIERCVQMLTEIDTNKKIIIVDHSTELKAMINDTITVIRNGETSRIQNVI